jgi:hypothetical protein
MEYIILQPLQTRSKSLNVSLVQRQLSLTPEEESLVLHAAGGPFAGFVVKKLLPIHMQASVESKSNLSFRLNVYVRHQHSNHSSDAESSPPGSVQQEQRTIEFWFTATASQAERMTCTNSFFHNLFKGDNFPKDYFAFLLRIMQIFKALKPIGQLRIGKLPSLQRFFVRRLHI